jgi:hypothetical protein
MRERLAAGALLGSIGGLVIALIDTIWTRQGIGSPPAIGAVLAAEAGVLIPLTLLLGCVVGVGSLLVHPRVTPSVGGYIAGLRDSASGRPADMAAFVPLCALGTFVWATASAHLARVALALELTPGAAGVSIALGAVVLALAIAATVLAMTPTLRRWLALGRSSFSGAVDPATTLGLALALIALLVGYGIVSGGVSGEGGVPGRPPRSTAPPISRC